MPPHEYLDPARIRRGLRTNIFAGMLGTAWIAMALTLPLTLLLEALGASGKQVGLAATVQQLAMAVQLPAALWVDRLPRRKPFWCAFAIPHRLLWFLPPILLLINSFDDPAIIAATLGMVGLSSILAHMTVPAWFAWMADLVPPGESGRFWGVRQSVTTAAFLVAMPLTGWLLETCEGRNGFILCFGIGALLGTLDILVHLGVPEFRPTAHASLPKLGPRLLAPFHNPDFLWTTLAFGAWAFSLGLFGGFIPVHLRRDLGIDYKYLVALPIATALGTVLTGLPLGRRIDRMGARGLAMLLFVAAPLASLFWLFLCPGHVTLWGVTLPQPMAVLLINHAVGGVLYAGIGLCQIHLVNTLTQKEGRAVSMALHWSLVGAMAALGPLIGGALLDLFQERGWSWITPWGAHFGAFQILILLHLLLSASVALPLLSRVHVRAGEFPASKLLLLLRPGIIFRPLFPFTSGWINTRRDED